MTYQSNTFKIIRCILSTKNSHSIFYCHSRNYIAKTYKYENSKFNSDTMYLNSRQVWVENLDTISEKRLGLINLHPQIFGFQPRIDLVHENVIWQKLYRFIVSIDSTII